MKATPNGNNGTAILDDSFPGISGPASAAELGEFEFTFISGLMHEISGVYLDAHKIPMIQVRLNRRLNVLKLKSFRDYVTYLRAHREEHEHLVNALTTHKTDFFREPEHFEFLTSHVLPEIVAKTPSKKIRIWSAAASTGEEIYTLGIVVSEFLASRPELEGWDWKVLGTDIDTNVLAECREGVYPSDICKQIRPDLLQKYFMRGTGKNAGFYRVGPELRRNVKFKQHNLLGDLSDFGDLRFQVTFLRNVLIYFQDNTREVVIDRMWDSLIPGGYLFVGHSEPLHSTKHKFKSVKTSVYQRSK